MTLKLACPACDHRFELELPVNGPPGRVAFVVCTQCRHRDQVKRFLDANGSCEAASQRQLRREEKDRRKAARIRQRQEADRQALAADADRLERERRRAAVAGWRQSTADEKVELAAIDRRSYRIEPSYGSAIWTRFFAIIAAVVIFGAGCHLAGARTHEHGIATTIANGIGWYFIGKSILIVAWTISATNRKRLRRISDLPRIEHLEIRRSGWNYPPYAD